MPKSPQYTNQVDAEARKRLVDKKSKMDTDQFEFDVQERIKELLREEDLENRFPKQ